MDKVNKTDTIWMLIFLYINFSLYFLKFGIVFNGLATFFMILGYQIITKKKIIFNKSALLSFIVLSFLICISCLINASFTSNDLAVILNLFLVVLMISTFELNDKFSEMYIRSMKILAFCSLIVFALLFICPNFLRLFPLINSDIWVGNIIKLHNIFISVVNIDANYKRNMGIFYEPGMYAFYLNIALFLMLFVSKKFNLKTFITIVLALITTFSTNGFLTFILIMLAFFTKKGSTVNFNLGKYKRYIFFLAILMIVFLTSFFINNPDNWHFLVSKIFEIGNNATDGSGVTRVNALKYSWESFKYNPMTGISIGRHEEFFNGNISTFTPLQWLADYGLFYGLFFLINLTLFAIKKNDGFYSNLFKVLAIFSMIISQNMTSNIILLMLIFYQATKNKKEVVK